MILMAPCKIDFIEANALLGPVGGGEGALDTPGPLNGIERSNAFRPYEIYYAQGHKNHRSIGNFM
jgi:hypothetical protein